MVVGGIELGVGREVSIFHFIIISIRNINKGKKNKKRNINRGHLGSGIFGSCFNYYFLLKS